MRRIMAWILLVLFALLIVNIMIFRVNLEESVIAYAVIVALFFFVKGLGARNTYSDAVGDGEDDAGTEENKGTSEQKQ